MPNLHNFKIKEGLIPALFFFIALVILIMSSFGILTGPGIIAALAGIYFSVKQKYPLASATGILAASSSFIGQSIVAFCPYCTSAAVMFMLAGIISLYKTARQIPIVSIALLLILTVSSLSLATSTGAEDTRSPVIQGSTKIVNHDKPEKTLVFLSVYCAGCKGVMQECIAQDPNGKYWQPIIVPHSSLYQGEEMLEKAGYTGEIMSAARPPANVVPVLVTKDGEIITAGNLKNYLKGGIGQ